MRWHKEERKQDSMLRNPVDGSQWRKIDRTYTDFTLDARNIRFSLSMDGMNPFGTYTILACHFMLIQSSTMALHEVKIHHDAGTYPGPKAARK